MYTTTTSANTSTPLPVVPVTTAATVTAATPTMATRMSIYQVQDDIIQLFTQTPMTSYDIAETVCVTPLQVAAAASVPVSAPMPHANDQASTSVSKRRKNNVNSTDDDDDDETEEDGDEDTENRTPKKKSRRGRKPNNESSKNGQRAKQPSKSVIEPSKKLEILDLHRQGLSVPRLAKQFNVGEQTIRDWKKNEKMIRQLAESNKLAKCVRKTIRGSNYPETDAALTFWYYQQRALDKPLSRTILAEKAIEFKSKCDKNVSAGTKDFEASSGFIDKFCYRHSIKIEPTNQASKTKLNKKLAVLQQSSITHDLSLKDELLRLLQIEHYSPHQLFYLCEAGFLWNALPSRLKNGTSQNATSASSNEYINERVTIGLCANSSGEFKLPPILVTNDKSMSSMEATSSSGSKKSSRKQFHLVANDEAWLHHEDFDSWFVDQFVSQVEEYLERVKLDKKAVLFIFKSPAHSVDLHLNRIECKFIPSGSSSFTPTLDNSWITHLKRQYRLDLLRDNLNNHPSLSFFDFMKNQVDFKYVIRSAVKIWDAMERSILCSLWHRIAYTSYHSQAVNSTSIQVEELKRFEEKFSMSESDLIEWFNVDANIAGYGLLNDEQIVQKVTSDRKRKLELTASAAATLVELSSTDTEDSSSVVEVARHFDVATTPKTRDTPKIAAKQSPELKPFEVRTTISLTPAKFDPKSIANPTPRDIINICSLIERWIDTLPQPDSRLYISLEYIRSAASKINLASLTASK